MDKKFHASLEVRETVTVSLQSVFQKKIFVEDIHFIEVEEFAEK